MTWLKTFSSNGCGAGVLVDGVANELGGIVKRVGGFGQEGPERLEVMGTDGVHLHGCAHAVRRARSASSCAPLAKWSPAAAWISIGGKPVRSAWRGLASGWAAVTKRRSASSGLLPRDQIRAWMSAAKCGRLCTVRCARLDGVIGVITLSPECQGAPQVAAPT